MKFEPKLAPPDNVKLERLTSLHTATHLAGLMCGTTGFDERIKEKKLNECLEVISLHYREALDEINRCSRETEGKVEPDPWFRLLHHETLLAIRWVEQEASKHAASKIRCAVYLK